MERRGENFEAVVQENPWKKEFQFTPEELTHFNEDSLSRSNYMDFMIRSHAVSEGVLGAQGYYIAYYEARNFDPINAIKANKEAGGWDALSESEKKIFEERFRMISEHKFRVNYSRVSKGEAFNDNLTHLLDYFQQTNLDEMLEETREFSWEDLREKQAEIHSAYEESRSLRDDFL